MRNIEQLAKKNSQTARIALCLLECCGNNPLVARVTRSPSGLSACSHRLQCVHYCRQTKPSSSVLDRCFLTYEKLCRMQLAGPSMCTLLDVHHSEYTRQCFGTIRSSSNPQTRLKTTYYAPRHTRTPHRFLLIDNHRLP